MKNQLILAAVAASIALAGSASAQVYGPAPYPVAHPAPYPATVPCPPAQRAYLIPDVSPCYRTTSQPCFNPIQGVGSVLGKIFSPTCFDTCKPCAPCP